MAPSVEDQAFGKERVEPAIGQLGNDGLDCRSAELAAEESAADVDEVCLAKGLGHAVVRSPQPVIEGSAC